jgi:hypothetical protein
MKLKPKVRERRIARTPQRIKTAGSMGGSSSTDTSFLAKNKKSPPIRPIIAAARHGVDKKPVLGGRQNAKIRL